MFGSLLPGKLSFKGDDQSVLELEDWLCRYNVISSQLAWNDAEKLKNVPIFLEGPIKHWANVNNFLTWKDFATKLKTKVKSRHCNAEYENQLRSRKKLSQESYESYYYEVLQLCKCANITADEKIIHHLIRGLPVELIVSAYMSKPKTPSDVLQHFQDLAKLESLLDVRHPNVVGAVSAVICKPLEAELAEMKSKLDSELQRNFELSAKLDYMERVCKYYEEDANACAEQGNYEEDAEYYNKDNYEDDTGYDNEDNYEGDVENYHEEYYQDDAEYYNQGSYADNAQEYYNEDSYEVDYPDNNEDFSENCNPDQLAYIQDSRTVSVINEQQFLADPPTALNSIIEAISGKPGTPFVKVKVCGVDLTALLDSGAVTSVISPTMFEKLQADLNPYTFETYESATGNVIQSVGKSNVTIQLCKEETIAMTILVANFSGMADVILGTDYLCARRACIDFASRSLVFPVPTNNEFVTIPLTFSAFKSECEMDKSTVSVSSIQMKPNVSTELNHAVTVNSMGHHGHKLPRLRLIIPAISVRQGPPPINYNTSPLLPLKSHQGANYVYVNTELEMLDNKFNALIRMPEFKQPKKQRWKPDLSFLW